jgi:hypothetical protein
MENQKEKENGEAVVVSNEYEGYSLFKDVEDEALRARNRAMILWNIFESYSKKGRATPKGMALMVGYTNRVPDGQRMDMLQAFNLLMNGGGNA